MSVLHTAGTGLGETVNLLIMLGRPALPMPLITDDVLSKTTPELKQVFVHCLRHYNKENWGTIFILQSGKATEAQVVV